MDPERVRAYLQVACAGLGFDIGEVWWTQNENGTSTVARIEERNEGATKPRFVQLYTSKSYANRRAKLLRPEDEEDEAETKTNNNHPNNGQGQSSNETAIVAGGRKYEKHVLSPLLVDAISRTAQVVWANTKKQEGLLGRSDIRLQTAVGMPVAVDSNGNMCCVVMFSPNNVPSTEGAMEYLQSITQSATSTSIPALMPAFDTKGGQLMALPHSHPARRSQVIPLLASPCSDGVTTRFVSLDENHDKNNPLTEVQDDHDLIGAPKDCYGIPMLPSFAELGAPGYTQSSTHGDTADVFDEASYGVWSTIMETLDQPGQSNAVATETTNGQSSMEDIPDPVPLHEMTEAPIYASSKAFMAPERKERLEEFTSAFLDVSVFEVADVWVPLGDHSEYLGNVTTISSAENNPHLLEFKAESEKVLIKQWSGAVGRAFASGNPVWSANSNVFTDSARANLFSKAKLQTALAIPVFSGKSTTPAFVLCCYSFVRTSSIPFVLKFVQQALRLLWDGLEKVEPHESVGHELWKDVAPADLGEMAADVEMHQHFMVKKRPREAAEPEKRPREAAEPVSERAKRERVLSMEMENLSLPTEEDTARSIFTGQRTSEPSPEFGPAAAPMKLQTFETVQTHLQNAVQSVAQDIFSGQRHVPMNSDGSARAYITAPPAPQPAMTVQPQEVKGEEDPFAPTPISQFGPDTPIPTTNQYEPQPSAVPVPIPMAFPQPQQQQQPINEPLHFNSNMNPPSPMQQPMALPNHIMANSSPVNGESMNGTMGSSPYQTYQQQPSQPGTSSSQHFHHTSQSQTRQNPVAAVPANQISATGISFPIPPPVPSSSSVPIVNGGPSQANANNQNAVSAPVHCVTANGNGKMPVALMSSGKPCRIDGCNQPTVARRPYCVKHSGNRICEHPTCTKCAQGSTRFCIAHGGGRRCTFPGCDKGARDKFFCAAHGGGKRCKHEGCTKSAVGGSKLCTAHGGGRRCVVEGCDKSAQSSTKFCVKHGGGKKCMHAGCEKVARGRTQFCAAHGGGVRCKLEGCNRVAIGKLQLCRTHGGGATRSRNKAVQPPHLPPGTVTNTTQQQAPEPMSNGVPTIHFGITSDYAGV